MKIGINVMSMISAMKEDFEGCIKRLNEGGCDYLEAMSDWGAKPETIAFFSNLTGGPSGWDPDNTVKRIEKMKEYGMSIKGTFAFEETILENADEMGAYFKENGIEYIVFSFLNYDGIEDIYSKVNLIKKLHKKLEKYNIQIILHNHEHDVLPMKDLDGNEKPILDIFLDNLSSEELMMEIDTGWLKYAGVDEVKYVEEYMDRIAILHLKDLCKGFENMPREDVFIACGKGCVDIKGIIDVSKHKQDMLYVLDQDDTKGDIIEDHIDSMKYIRSLF